MLINILDNDAHSAQTLKARNLVRTIWISAKHAFIGGIKPIQGLLCFAIITMTMLSTPSLRPDLIYLEVTTAQLAHCQITRQESLLPQVDHGGVAKELADQEPISSLHLKRGFFLVSRPPAGNIIPFPFVGDISTASRLVMG